MEILSSDVKPVSVVCIWFVWHPPLYLGTFIKSPTSNHCRIKEYALTLTEGCFKAEQIEECTVKASIFEQSVKKLKLASSNYLSICKESMQFLAESLAKEAEPVVIDLDSDTYACIASSHTLTESRSCKTSWNPTKNHSYHYKQSQRVHQNDICCCDTSSRE